MSVKALELNVPKAVVTLSCNSTNRLSTLQRHDWETGGFHFSSHSSGLDSEFAIRAQSVARFSPDLSAIILSVRLTNPDSITKRDETYIIDWRSQVTFETGPVGFPDSLYSCKVNPILIDRPHVFESIDPFGFETTHNYEFYGSSDLYQGLDSVDQMIALVIASGLPDDVARIALSDELTSMTLKDFFEATQEYDVHIGWNAQPVTDCQWFDNGNPRTCKVLKTACAKVGSFPTFFQNGFLETAETQVDSICFKDQSTNSQKLFCQKNIQYNESGKAVQCDGKAVQ